MDLIVAVDLQVATIGITVISEYCEMYHLILSIQILN